MGNCSCDIQPLAAMEYPGRYILMEIDPTKEIVVYGITGRSPSSQARRLVQEEARIYVEPTNEDELKKGNPDLLIYDAIQWDDDAIAVSNGKQTKDIFDSIASDASADLPNTFASVMSRWHYEPDYPNFTPRIFGTIAQRTAYLGTVFMEPTLRDDVIANVSPFAPTKTEVKPVTGGCVLVAYNNEAVKEACLPEPERHFFALQKGNGITTYEGPNVPHGMPLPSYVSDPFSVSLRGSAADIAQDVWSSITKDFRVSVAALVRYKGSGEVDTHIVNRNL